MVELLVLPGSQILTSSGVIFSTFLSIIGFYKIALRNIGIITIPIISWINTGEFESDWGFQFDSITISMCVIILSISSLVHIYSIGYMQCDPHIQRFFSYLSLFTFFMLILASGANYFVLFVGLPGQNIP